MTPIFEVIRAGTMATIQDLGRPGHQRFGMPVSGAMDAFSLQAANLLVGNEPDLAALEIALGGLELRAADDCVVAICGAALGARLDDQPCPLWKSLAIRRGQRLAWSGGGAGVWSYLAVGGGLDRGGRPGQQVHLSARGVGRNRRAGDPDGGRAPVPARRPSCRPRGSAGRCRENGFPAMPILRRSA